MSNQIDIQFVKPFVDGTVQTLRIQCGLESTHGKPYLKGKGVSGQTQVDIAGLIGLTSGVFKGSISLAFPEKTFLAVMGKMLGETYESLTPDLEDGAGELMNIIFGTAKKVLNERGYAVQKALPSVIRGVGLTLRHVTPIPVVVLPFKTPVGDFQIEVAIEPLDGKSKEE